jgi:radical SAM superfamily enzyme YgiQ (UPF0313 family)
MSDPVGALRTAVRADDARPRLCFIIPPSGFLLDERVFMTLGILRVAAVAEAAGYPVDVLDLSGVNNVDDVLGAYMDAHDTQIFALTATTPQMPAATAITRSLRRMRPTARLILGGPHITLVNAAVRQEAKAEREGRAHRALAALQRDFDTLVAGDGEEAIFVALEQPQPLIDADDPHSAMFLTNARLSELPLPARHLVDVSSYHYQIEGVPAISLIAQLGCPFSCGFCGGRRSAMLRRIRMRSKESVLHEIRHLHESYGVKGFMLYDDELNVNKGMVELMNGIADLQSDLGVEFRLRGFIKAELFEEEQAAAMHRAGFRWILTGFESGAPRILKNINKKATRDENTRCVDIARRHGLKVKALMSLGHPGESEETARQTEEWLLETRPDDFDVTIITTYPGTPYYDDAVPHDSLPGVYTYTYNGDRLHAHEVDYTTQADYYKGDPEGGYRSFVFTDFLSAEDLVSHRDAIERRVREALGIAYNPRGASVQYEHSMGQRGIPASILRSSDAAGVRRG